MSEVPARIPVVALIGRTNVGKSTLFNALCGKRRNLVADSHGVTRDRSTALISRGQVVFRLVDTGGLLGDEVDEYAGQVAEQTAVAIDEADLIIALFDGVAGVHPDDRSVVSRLREAGKPVIWVVNKCEKPSTEEAAVEFYGLGIDDYVTITAAHRRGLHEIYSRLDAFLKSYDLIGADEPSPDEERGIRVAVIGKPNVGKSSLVNALLGSNRLITADAPGTTRDSVDVEIEQDGQSFIFIDTAGLRKKSQIEKGSLERLSTLRTTQAIARSDVAVLVIDAAQGEPTDQDIRTAQLVHDRGIPLILAANKWDAVDKDHRTVKAYKDELYSKLRFCRYAPLLFTSALTGKRCSKLFDIVKEVHEAAGERVKTSTLNKIVEKAFEKHPPPVYRGQRIKLFFATQVAARPPTIVVFVNYPKQVAQSYERYLLRQLREAFPFTGSDIKLILRKRRSRDESIDEKEERRASG